MKTKTYLFWNKIKAYADGKMQAEWLKYRGWDSSCPRCKMWCSQGNKIYTEALDVGVDKRTCSNCKHTWSAIFTPAGFIPIDDDAS